MKVKKVFILIISTLFLFACREGDPSTEFLRKVSSDVVLSGYQGLNDSAIKLYEEALTCKQEGANYKKTIETIQVAWKQAMAQWQRVQWVQFGPIKQDGREWSLQFWPDKKNLVGKKVKRLLKKRAVITDQQIETGGVIVQGLSALEYLLFDQSMETLSNKQRCLSIIPVAKKMQANSKGLVADWKSYYKQNMHRLDKPSPAAEIITVQQGVSTVINNLIVFFDNVMDKKLASPFSIKKENIKSNAYFLESWRSQTSRDNIENNILLVKSVFLEGGLQKLLDKNNYSVVGESALKEIDSILNLLKADQSHSSFFKQISYAEKQSTEDIQLLYQNMLRLRAILRNDVTKALNVKIGFNSSDGDS